MFYNKFLRYSLLFVFLTIQIVLRSLRNVMHISNKPDHSQHRIQRKKCARHESGCKYELCVKKSSKSLESMKVHAKVKVSGVKIHEKLCLL